jgi:hypothetical protein
MEVNDFAIFSLNVIDRFIELNNEFDERGGIQSQKDQNEWDSRFSKIYTKYVKDIDSVMEKINPKIAEMKKATREKLKTLHLNI